MFNNLLDLGYTRSNKEAFGFYVAYFILFVVGVGISYYTAALLGIVDGNDFRQGIRFGGALAIIISALLCFLVIHAKKRWSYSAILFIALSAGLAILGGVLLGFIPIAYLTTKEKRSSETAGLDSPMKSLESEEGESK